MFSGLMAEANIDLLNRLFMPTDCTEALTINWPSHYPPPPHLAFFFRGESEGGGEDCLQGSNHTAKLHYE